MSTASAALTFLLLMDPLGNLPLFASALDGVEPIRRRRVLARELLFALACLMAFLFVGRHLFSALGLQAESVSIAGGAILAFMGFKMLFPKAEEASAEHSKTEPFLVPLAIPLVAGPSTFSLIFLLTSREPERLGSWTLAIVLAWAGTALVLLLSGWLRKVLGSVGMDAVARIMGLLLLVISVQMLVDGLTGVIQSLPLPG